ncbi:hypothetical protein [Ktedonobacter sp. SOSP1-52]|uniref:hypothetical protein n=1 Tax=Ktedonobacter sp. SOSP1-52 TaxID=2778366 RepID=UPI001F3DF247|nr:hypothetical protein [Ktedonobacter sp. SOSP1-52]
MPKRATVIQLSEQEQEELTRLTKRHRSERQVVLRARIILTAAQGSSNAQIARVGYQRRYGASVKRSLGKWARDGSRGR